MAKYDACLNIGHGNKYDGTYDPGACYGNYQEHLIATQIVENAAPKIRAKGINLHVGEQNYSNNILSGNTYAYNYAMSVHLNAGGGKRAEIWCPCKDNWLDVEFYVLSELSKLGLNNGGVKSRDFSSEQTFIRSNGVALNYTDYYGEINRAKAQGISLDILETGFIDSSDRDIILNNIDRIGTIIANAFCMACDKELYSIDVKTTEVVKEEENYSMYVFSKNWYLSKYSDVAKSSYKDNPYSHYEKYGKSEGRQPLPPVPKEFCEGAYLELNPDVKAAVENGSYTSGLHHYLMYGFAEPRKITYTDSLETIKKRCKELEIKLKEIKKIVE
ncbi:MAG: hypothetical protein PUJ51_06065 [Clostridiales bacterium]|nr:hypothetical protein [Clostridiales bacterium]